MVLLKNSFSRRYLQNQLRCTVLSLHRVGLCAELEIEMSTNPKLANTVRSQTNNFDFWKSPFPGNLGSIWWYFERFQIFFENPNLANTAWSQQLNFPKIQKGLTLRGVELCAVLACMKFCQHQFCKTKSNSRVCYTNQNQHFLLAFNGLAWQKKLIQCSFFEL